MSSDAEDRAAAEAAGLSPEQQAALTKYHSEENWVLLHRPQLQCMQLPQPLWSPLYHKLYTEQFDALDTFAVAQSEEDGDEGFHLVVEADLGVKAQADVFIFEHAWDVKADDAVQQLLRTPALVDRLYELMDLDRRLQHEAALTQARQEAEVEARRRQEDRKEPDDVEAERRLKEAADEKQRDRDRREAGEGEAEGEEQWVDEDALSAVMTQTSASREAAAQALKSSRGDLIDAINSLSLTDSPPPPSSTPSAPTPSPSAAPPSVDVSSLSDEERRAKEVWDGMFRYGYVRQFYTTVPRDDGRPLTAADVTTMLYVEDEVASAVVAAEEPNARIHSLYCVTLNTPFSVMWITSDLEQGDEVIRSLRPLLKKTREWAPTRS